MKCSICGAEIDKLFFTGKIVWSFGHDKKIIHCRWCNPTYNVRVEKK